MKVGYRISYFGFEEGNAPNGLPDYLLCDDTLDGSLEKIRECLRALLLDSQDRDISVASFVSVSISILGPFPEDQCFVDRRTPELRLADANSPEDRFVELGSAAISRIEAEDFESARLYIEELEGLLPAFKNHLYFNDSLEKVHIVLGRLALRAGNVEEARARLIQAASTKGSPTMCSFGPNMSLARDMLLAGEWQAVLDYFDACRKFWESGSDQLDEWKMYINAGRLPDFGANLVY